MWKLVALMAVVAVFLTAGFMLHGLATGIVVPYQDPTPEQAAYERHHLRVGEPIFLAAAVAWLMTCVLAVAAVGRCLLRAKARRAKPASPAG